MIELKRCLILGASLVLAAVDWLVAITRKIAGRKSRGICVVLMYHGVPTSLRSQFAKQMDLVMRLAKPVPADVPLLSSEGSRYVAITFDDGLESTVNNALPILMERNIPATLFIVPGALGQEPNWEHYKAGQETVGKTASAEALRSLPTDLFTVGSHTMTHPMLSVIGENEVRQELIGSRQTLEELLNREVKLLSFPYGKYTSRVLDICREAGYSRVFSSAWHRGMRGQNEFLTARVKVEPTDWLMEVRLKVLGAYRWLSSVETMKGRVRTILGRSPVQKAIKEERSKPTGRHPEVAEPAE